MVENKKYILKSELEKTSAQKILAGETGILDLQTRSASVTAAIVDLKNNNNLSREERQRLIDYVKKWRGQAGLRNIGGNLDELID